MSNAKIVLFILSIILILFGCAVPIFSINVNEKIIVFISVFSSIVSLALFSRAMYKRNKEARKKAFKFAWLFITIVVYVLVLITPTLLVFALSNPNVKPQIDIMSNYSTVTSFGVVLLSIVIEGSESNNKRRYLFKKSEDYIVLDKEKRVQKKRLTI